MKKLFTMLFTLLSSFAIMQAQQWWVYDASDLPENSGFSTSSVKSGPNENIRIIPDGSIPGNYYLRYEQPDPNDGSIKFTKAYKLNFEAGTGHNGYTVIARMKGLNKENINAITELQILSSTFNTRQYVQVDPSNDQIKFAQNDKTSGASGVNTNKWQIYRFTFGSDSMSNVYVNEAATAVLTTKNTSAKTDNYFRFGDGGSAQTAGDIDWIIIDTTGAYAPGAGSPIPDSLSTETNVGLPGDGYSVVFMSNTEMKDTNGYYADSMFVVDLKSAGFSVVVPDYPAGELPSAFTDAIDASDLVVIGRTPGSSDLAAQRDYWSRLQKPIISMNTYGARANKMGWLPSVTVKYGTDYGVQEAKAQFVDDTIFKNLGIGTDSIIDFNEDYLSFVVVEEADLARTNGKTLLTIANGVEAYDYKKTVKIVDTIQFGDYDGNLLMMRWDPAVAVNDSMFSGAFVDSKGASYLPARPFHYRTFLSGGDDHQYAVLQSTDTVPLYGMYMYSDLMNQALVNECIYLAGLDGPDISDDNTLDTLSVSVGALDPAFAPEVVNYTCKVPKGTTSITLAAKANHAEANVDGDGTYTLDGSDTTIVITVTSQAGTPNEYKILVKEEIEAVGNLIPPGTNTISEFLAKGEYDEYLLVNGGIYEELDPIVIDRKVTLKAQDTVTLPALDNLPVIKNTNAVVNMIQLLDSADLTLFGVEMDGMMAATKAISFLSDENGNVIQGIHLIRCRIHDVTGDILGGTKSDTVTIKSATFVNTFIYNAGAHGLYVKDSYANDGNNDKYVYSNLTFWNLGQQLVWIQILTDDAVQEWEFDHMTGYNLSTGGDKELIGNSNGGGQYDIQLTNSIFSKQNPSTADGSLMFTTENTNGADNIFEIRNIVVHDCRDIANRPGSKDITMDNILNADPQFADPDNGNFTIGNADYLTAGDDGTILGALYWHPDYVDDYADYETVSSVENYRSDMKVEVYPMPFNDEVNFDLYLENNDVATVSIIDVTGRTVKLETFALSSGYNQFIINTSDIETGTYYFTLSTSEGFTTGTLVKAE